MTVPRVTLSLQPGTEVAYAGKRGHITHILDFESVLVKELHSGKPERVRIVDLQPVALAAGSKQHEPQIVPDDDWNIAQERFEIIRPLLDPTGRKRADVEARATETGKHANTLYKWIGLYQSQGRITALLPMERKDKGTTKLSAEVEAIIQSVIENEYLTKQNKSIAKVCQGVRSRCLAAKLEIPHNNTIRNRVAKLSEELKISRRRGKKIAEQQFSPILGEFPGADFPLAVVQMDHTKLDIILVDDIHRRPIGRPWITLAMDVFSRVVAGSYVSFDPPGALSTGLCLAHGILPKDAWLARHEIDEEWPLWGFPAKILVDNAKEFRGSMLQRACQQYGIDLEWRPVARPHYGAHIERLLGTFLQEIHSLPGTTFSNTQARGEYDSDGQAVMTLSEFERWLATYIVEVYHRREHSSLGMSPLDKLKEGIFGTAQSPGSGLPPKIVDENRLRLDLMPFVERTVQDYGVVIDDVHYYHDVLRRWINATEPGRAKIRRKFMFRRDPRDISTVWFYDPELMAYYPVPYRDTSHPPISIWELREAKGMVTTSGTNEDTERAIFTAYDRMRQIEEAAKGKTKAVRRAAQRRSLGIGQVGTRPAIAPEMPTKSANEPIPDIRPFDDMDDQDDE